MNSFMIDSKLPSLNEYVNACRSHWSRGAEFKKSIEAVIGSSITKGLATGTLHKLKNPVEIYIEFHEATKRRDCDNIQSSQKFILDALQHYGIIKNDNRKFVKQIHHKIVDDRRDFVIVELKEDEANDK